MWLFKGNAAGYGPLMAAEARQFAVLHSPQQYAPGDVLGERVCLQDSFGLIVRNKRDRIPSLVVIDVCRVDEDLKPTTCYESAYHRFSLDGIADLSLSGVRVRWPVSDAVSPLLGALVHIHA